MRTLLTIYDEHAEYACLVLISFPPMTGHSTLTTLCGFAYGMKGFAITAVASVFGSALAFVILRTTFNARLRSWSSKNEKWQALESVMVCPVALLIPLKSEYFDPESKRVIFAGYSFEQFLF